MLMSMRPRQLGEPLLLQRGNAGVIGALGVPPICRVVSLVLVGLPVAAEGSTAHRIRLVDLAFAAFPEGRSQLEFLELAGGGAGELGAELDALRALVTGELLLGPGDHVVLGEL